MRRFVVLLLSFAIAFSGSIFAYAGDEISLEIRKDDVSHAVSPVMYGVSLDNSDFACDGGLNANMVSNNSFEFAGNPNVCWEFYDLTASVEDAFAMNDNNVHYEKIKVKKQGYARNTGYSAMYDDSGEYDELLATTADMGFKEGEYYEFSCFLKNVDFKGTISVYLDSNHNKSNLYQLSTNNLSNSVWKKFTAKVKSEATENGALAIVFKGEGTLCMDYVSLVPYSSYGYAQEQWKYTYLRSDLEQAIANLNPSFIRFPDFSTAGSTKQDPFSWKETIGSAEERRQRTAAFADNGNIKALSSSSVGYHECFQLCEDLSAEAVPVVGVGFVCPPEEYELMLEAYEKLNMTDDQYFAYLENEKGFSAHDASGKQARADMIASLGIASAEDWKNYLDDIALVPGTDEFSNYTQDVLDLIEYANGDSITSYWGSLRALNGHQLPFDMKYIALGSYNYGDLYIRNFKALESIIKEKYPDITVICASKGTDNTLNINSTSVIDEKINAKDDELLQLNNRYDSYLRGSNPVMISSLNCDASGNGNDLMAAVEEASFLAGLERNGDIVCMNSYAPCLRRVNACEDKLSLIWFDSRDIALTPSYYARLIFANNYGTQYLNSSFKGYAGDMLYQSTTIDAENEVAYIKIVNSGKSDERIKVNISGFGDVNCVSCLSISGGKDYANKPGKQMIAPSEKKIKFKDNAFDVESEGYSATVIRVAYGNNKGNTLYKIPKSINLETKGISKSELIVLIVVVVAVFLVSSVAGFFIYTKLILKKRKKKNE